MKDKLYNQEGEIVGEIELPERVFGLQLNQGLIHQAVVAQQSNRRQVLAHTKDRSEVRGGGRKPWRQKGTGRARHGSRRSPLWVGGGVTFGPSKHRNFSQKINKKMKRQAMYMALASRWQEKHSWFLNNLQLDEAKTKNFNKIIDGLIKKLTGWSGKRGSLPTILLVVPQKEENLKRASRNLSSVTLIQADSLNVYDVLANQYLFLTQDSLLELSSKVKSKK